VRRQAPKHAVDGRHPGWQTLAVRGVLLPAVVLALVLGVAEIMSPGTPPARSAQSPPVRLQPEPGSRPAPGGVGNPKQEATLDEEESQRAAAWKKRISSIARGRSVGIALRLGETSLYEHSARGTRVPASNQKLLLSMALFDLLDPNLRISTKAVARRTDGSVVAGHLYVLGAGDPTISGGGRFGSSLPIRPTRLKRLARHIKQAGIRRIEGSVIGSTNYFTHDWFAPGWKPEFPSQFIAIPTALTFDGNSHRGIHISDPERRAAVSLTRKLEAIGVAVNGSPSAGVPPSDTTQIARVQSEPLRVLARFMNRTSSNFFAEVLGKRLGAEHTGRPGTIAKGAEAIRSWVRSRGVGMVAKDSSGLSYSNRISPRGISKLLGLVEAEKWWHRLRSSLPTGGEGTLQDRLGGVRVRAKTGTLEGYSALSGWVWLKRRDEWAAFSILSAGMPKYRAAAMEDRIVRTIAERAR
jgi:serine-type D-Ala-D-Ala carboxypeptidase/endopeptidase (penicillin-binding protein 4)